SILAIMPTLQIVSSKSGAGKSTIAVALAQGFAREGHRVRIERMGEGRAATEDAETFGEYLFAASSGQPISTAPAAGGSEVGILELAGGSTPDASRAALVAVHSAPDEADNALASLLGDRLIGSIAVAVDPSAVEDVARDLTNGGLRPLALVPEDL